jgi:hypothetical protein
VASDSGSSVQIVPPGARSGPGLEIIVPILYR